MTTCNACYCSGFLFIFAKTDFTHMATYTQDMYTSLVESIAIGAKEVWYGNKRVAYRSLDEMRALKNEMEIDLGLRKKSDRYFANFSKGV